MRYHIRAIVLLLVIHLCSVPVFAAERITHFDSLITVENDGDLLVTETISVIAEGQQIKRGIYRDFPTKYTTDNGRKLIVGFELIEVKRDGKPEPHHITEQSNGVRIYIGDKNTYLEAGPYSYTITYRTNRQIGFFLDYDELYWNVTGNGWAFPIVKATATVHLPEGASILQHSVYTGPQGSKLSDGHATEQFSNRISFETTVPLAPKNGLTIAVSWPKGIVQEPDSVDNALFFIGDHLAEMAGLAGVLVLLLYYSVAWAGVGKDPDAGAVIPRFEPPPDFTPAASRFVMKMGFDNKAFTSAIVNMAVKNQLKIDDKEGTFTLRKTNNGNQQPLSSGEARIMKQLFSRSDTIELKQSNHKRLRKAISAMKESIQTDFETMHFKRNSIYLLPGAAITLIIIVFIIITAQEKIAAVFMTVWLSFWTMGCYGLFLKVYNGWKVAFSQGAGILRKVGALFTTLFAVPFLIGLIAGNVFLAMTTSVGSIVALFSALLIHIIFYHLLKAPTVQGRRIMDQLEGFKMYLSVAEKERLNLFNSPQKTPELYEKFLPWALALEVEQQWSEQFSEILEKASREENYSPSWYHSSRPFTSASLASSLGPSLSSTISSSSRSPGSSSGSSGGGSSGGGGGGGGGGGW